MRTSAEFADRLIDESYVVTTPGEAFDAPGFLRISYANSLERPEEACDRIAAFVKTLDQTVARRSALSVRVSGRCRPC